VVDVTGALSYGQTASAALTTPGQRGVWTFAGTAGESVSAVINSSTVGGCGSGGFAIVKPDGTTFLVTTSVCAGAILGPSVLPTTGTYTVVVDPSGAYTGNVTMTVYNVVDVTGALSYGQTASAALTTPGQRGVWTFAGTAGESVRALITASTIGSCSAGVLSVLKPDNVALASTGTVCVVTLGPMTLPTTGTYTVVVDPSGITTGSVTVSVVSP
jgi:hypothetical protein